jgi:predicted MFS family arabinose efflux permease
VTASTAATKPDSPAGVFATVRATPASVRYLLAGVLVNQMGAFMLTFLVLYLTTHGFSAGRAGIALAAYSGGAVSGALLGGEMTHRFGPRATIVGAMSASALFVALVPWLAEPARFGPLLVAVVLAGLATQSYRPAAAVMLSDLMPEEHRVMAFSMFRVALNIGAALGPLIAAGLILVDWNLLFWFDALTALAYAVLAFTLLPDAPAPDEEEKPAGDERPAYLVLAHDGRYLVFLASVLFGTLIYVQYAVALPLMIKAAGHPEALYSAVLATSSVALVLCELKVTSYVKRLRPHLVGAAGQAVLGLGVAAYGLSTGSPALIVLSTVVFVSGVMISGPTMFAYPATFPAAVKARYIAAQQATFGLGLALGPLFGVFAWEALRNRVWPLCGILGVIGAFCALVGIRDDAPSPAVPR